ncbi:acyl-CoA dehydrogenase family protein [Pseudomonas sp. NPDC007930]|uniref:acyl-CoA dehydrogenase family protein n=1 Tax=Pseudomonas sp. NPDC007930 TaxID=3364417 RepID=UPI0036EC1E69
MNFDYEPAHERVYNLVGELGRARFFPRAAQHEQANRTPVDNLRDLFDAGLLGLSIRKSAGGGGGGALGEDPLVSLLVVEQTARYCLSTAQCIHIHYNAAHMVDQIGTDEQRERILQPVLQEGELLNATGSEPGRTARGLYGLTTVARPVEGGYRVSGVKNYATLAAEVSHNILYAVIEGIPAPEGHLGLMIPRGAAGLIVRPDSWNPMGMRAAHSPDIQLDDVFVSHANVLGSPGQFPRDHWQTKSHLSFAAQYLGACEGIFDLLVDYLPKRGTAHDSYSQLRLGEIRIAIDSARWMIYRAVGLWRKQHYPQAELFSMNAKHQAMSAAVVVMDKAAQIAGSSAFSADAPLARALRDLRVQTLHENLDKTAATIGKYHLDQPYDTSSRL